METCGFYLLEETQIEPASNVQSTDVDDKNVVNIPTDKVEAVKYFLNQLPDGDIERALGQLDELDIVRWSHCKKMEEAIGAFAIWHLTKEGYAFWSQIPND